jgi:hypothetical protein
MRKHQEVLNAKTINSASVDRGGGDSQLSHNLKNDGHDYTVLRGWARFDGLHPASASIPLGWVITACTLNYHQEIWYSDSTNMTPPPPFDTTL